MRKFIWATVVLAVVGGAVAVATAQQDQPHHGMPAPKAAGSGDSRVFVQFPPELGEHTLANMRDHLLALQEMQDHLGMGRPDVAARIAEERLGMSSLETHGAREVAKYMPQGMQDAGSAMHRAASQFAIVAKDAAVTDELKPVFSALAKITAQCVGCHAGYRIK